MSYDSMKTMKISELKADITTAIEIAERHGPVKIVKNGVLQGFLISAKGLSDFAPKVKGKPRGRSAAKKVVPT
jgi:fructoselysine-6-P-deglycase FrlB-like protein